jgi:tetratricopeptide (TPR) repeat protein
MAARLKPPVSSLFPPRVLGGQYGKRAMNAIPHSRKYSAITVLAALALMVTGLSGCDKLKARDLLNQGTQAYKDGLTDKAIEDFKQATDLDPTLLMARLYLATAYQGQFIPGAPSEENKRNGTQALEEYQKVLSVDPNNLTALDGIGSLMYAMAATPYTPAKFEESKSYHEKHIALKPDDPDPYYWVGVIDWTLAWHANQEFRADYNRAHAAKQIKDDQPLPADLRDQFAAKYSQTVSEGMDALKKAMDRKPDYDDAMAYLSLLNRQQADMTADQSQRDQLLKTADQLMEQVKQIKQKKSVTPAG